jgi:hypothetical protein
VLADQSCSVAKPQGQFKVKLGRKSLMLDEKLRIAPTCYHVLHLIPVMSAHEMGFFYDEGLKSEDGSPAYKILRQAMVPFGLEKMGISQALPGRTKDQDFQRCAGGFGGDAVSD